jgi:hypothetical protein
MLKNVEESVKKKLSFLESWVVKDFYKKIETIHFQYINNQR